MKALFRVVAAAVVTIVAITGLSATATPAEAAGAFHRSDLTSACTDVLVLGARGSGQVATDAFGVGPEVYLAIGAYAQELPGYDIGFDYLTYAAQDVRTLIKIDRKGNVSLDGKTFLGGLDNGVDQVISHLQLRSARCPDERYVLSGYSQGAMVMRRAITALAGQGATPGPVSPILAKVHGVLAIADGDRYPGQGGRHYSTAGAGSNGIGWLVKSTLKSRQTKAIPSAAEWPSDRYHSVCHLGDLVCDVNSTTTARNPVKAAATHGTIYKPNAAGAAAVISAASSIAETTRALKPLAPSECTEKVPCDSTWVGIMTFSKELTAERNVQADWITRIEGAELDEYGFMPGIRLQYTATVAGRYPWGARLTHSDGRIEEVFGVIVAYDVPPQSLHISSYTTGYVDNLDGNPYSTIRLTLVRVRPSSTTPSHIAASGSFGVKGFTLVTGDTDDDFVLDLGEAWVYEIDIPWNSYEPGRTREANIVVEANDHTLVPRFSFEELTVPITLSKI